MSLTAEQLVERRAYLGGTDAAAIAGVNPPGWAQPIDVHLEKLGLLPERAPSAAMQTGDLLEPVVAGLFTRATGITLRRPAQPVRHPVYRHMGGHIDRWASDGSIFEAKWSMSKRGWGEGLGIGTLEAPVIIPGPDEPAPQVPLHYGVQVQHYLAVTGRPLCYLAVLLGWGDFRWYALWRDEVMIGHLIELERDWWERHGPPNGTPPEPDGSEGYGRHLRRLYAADDGGEAIATPEQQQLAEDLRAARAQLGAAQRAHDEVEQRLMASMGSTARLIGPGFQVSWQRTKPRTRVRWEDYATELLHSHVLLQTDDQWPTTKKAIAEAVREDARIGGFVTEEEGARPFRVTFEDEEASDAPIE